MLAITALCISLVALIFSGIALSITYRKEAHRVRLELTPAKYGVIVLGINNDSGIDTFIRSLGYFHQAGRVTWFADLISNNVTNKMEDLPVVAKARSTYEVYLNTIRDIPDFSKAVGLCVQLETGRVFVLPRQIALIDSLKMKLGSLISRLSGGNYAPWFDRPRAKLHN